MNKILQAKKAILAAMSLRAPAKQSQKNDEIAISSSKTPRNDKKQFVFLALVIILLALISRFIFLSARPVHHDEGMLAYFAWKLSDFGEYIYTPQIHGPILFYIEALIFKIFKAGDHTLRVGPGFFGALLIFLPLALYRQIGKKRAIILAILFLVSPLFLYFSRFLVHSSMVVVFWFLLIVSLYRFFKNYDPVHFYLIFVWLAFAFGTSETTYIFLAVVISSVIPMVIAKYQQTKEIWHGFVKYLKANPLDLLAGVLLFVAVWAAIYSVFFTNLKSLMISVPNQFDPETGLGFWLAQNPKKLGGQPWHYYLVLAVVYEPLAVLGSVLGIINLFRRRRIFTVFTGWLAVATTAVFSIAGEKFPWLFICSLSTLTVFAGFYFADNWARFRLWFKLVIIVLLVFSLFNAIRLNYISAADTNELAVYVQTPISFKPTLKNIASNCQNSGAKDCVLIDQQITWPLSWSYRDFSSLYYPDSLQIADGAKFILVAYENIGKVEVSSEWTKSQVTLRDWWVPEKCNLLKDSSCAGKFIKYFLLRKTWNEKGGYDIYVFEKV